ncbi:hypothetical protein NL676_028830 [Syzygium grande]|nr:hypothetical protein NL676_028830 [Syzygium grande]
MDVGLDDTIGGRIIFFIDLGSEFPLIMPFGVSFLVLLHLLKSANLCSKASCPTSSVEKFEPFSSSSSSSSSSGQ